LNEKKGKNKQQLNENNSTIQQEKKETVVIESDQNTITSFDETKTQQHSQLINQAFILHKSTIKFSLLHKHLIFDTHSLIHFVKHRNRNIEKIITK
jgi:hypothetical protein